MSPRPDFPAQQSDERADELIIGEAVALDVRATSFVLRAAGAIIDVIAYLAFLLLLFLDCRVRGEPSVNQSGVTH